MVMKILFINPLFRNNIMNTKFRNVDNIVSPLGILYIASLLKQHNIKSIFLDGLLFCSNISDFSRRIKKHNPDIVGITSMTSNFDIAKDIAREIKTINKDIVTVLGGSHVTALPNCIKDSGFDIGVIGEGEFTFLELVLALKNKSTISDIRGIVYKNGNSITINKLRPLLKEIDILPYPERELLKSVHRYHPAVFNYKHLPCVTILTSRGCNYKCLYCINSLSNSTFWRGHSVDYVLGEIEKVVVKYSVRNFWILDDDFAFDKGRVYSICREILKRNLKINWSCMMRVNSADYELLKIMKAAGCWQIAYGIESGSQRILDIINKKCYLTQIRQAVNLTKKARIEIKGFFILGLPTETAADIKKTLNLATSLPLDYATFFPLNVIPGTLLEKKADRCGRVIKYPDRMKMPYANNVFIPNTLSEAELIIWQKKAYYRFYFRLGYVLRQIIKLKSFNDLKKKILALGALLFQ